MTQPRPVREFHTAFTHQPKIALLGAAPFTTVITNAGGGQSVADGTPVTRWRRDPTLDDHGQWIYVRDVTREKTWSAAHQPVCAKADSYRVRFDAACATFERRDGDIETRMDVVVSTTDIADVRKVTITNTSASAREIELTSYSEVVMNAAYMDRGHPAFSNLFVQTEWLGSHNAILAMRRPRSATMKPAWGGHVVAVAKERVREISCETDRSNFIGRGRSARNAAAMRKPGLSGRVGAVLDPIFSIRTRLMVHPGESVSAVFTTFIAGDRQHAVRMATRFSDLDEAVSVADIAAAQADQVADGIPGEDASLYQMLAGHLLFPPDRDAEAGSPGSAGLFPLVVATIDDPARVQTIRDLLKLHRYWQVKGIETDLLIVAAEAIAAVDELAPYTAGSINPDRRVGEVVVRSLREIELEKLKRIHAVARLHIDCDAHTLESFANEMDSRHPADTEARFAAEIPARKSSTGGYEVATADGSDLRFFNGVGGFNGSDEYEIRLASNRLPPAPWINVIANESGGFTISETGAGCTWAISGSSFRLTPWHNDPVCDRPGECIYLRDDESGDLWSATAQPIAKSTYADVVKHGPGYSIFGHFHDGIMTSLRVGMPETDAVKLQILTITNSSNRPRKLSVVSYAEWVLGTDRETTRLAIDTSFDASTEVTLATNRLNPEFSDVVAFHSMSEPIAGRTSSRTEFLGRNGTHSSPLALTSGKLADGEARPLDPCSAMQAQVELAPGETRSIAISLGATTSRDAAIAMATKYKSPHAANAAIDASVTAWRKRLDTIVVRTPEKSFDLMLNQWAYYQALSSRLWGRNALYQSSGAYGFRDQLQDVTAFVYSEPRLAREQILRAASRQFEEGDVQHWWHPHSGKGIRTLFSDDLIWLPFVTDHYLRVTHDTSVLEERTRYLHMRQLEQGEDELFAVPDISDKSATVFEHCIHALQRACTAGAHGLPLMGSGDWNDGMNRVGIDGKGESVWLAWFLITTLRRFADHAEARGHPRIAADLREKADNYKEAVESSAWDGDWYRRAYYDDGAALGSHVNEECKIDSIAQSWSVISGAGDPERSRMAMQSLNDHLVREDARLLMLLTPPFDRGAHDPGYIQGYLPGVRENGAQYTHAALWAVMATAMQGHGDRAMQLYQMINPITHSSTPRDIDTYKVEPYVVAADVYTAEGHLGRGGWTWYTGSASWLYRVGLESILGFRKSGAELVIDPCIPGTWKEFAIEYKYGSSVYVITVLNPSGLERGIPSIEVDGASSDRAIRLVDDGKRHAVTVTMGAASN